LVLLIKEIGTDALFALMRLLARAGEAQGLERVRTAYRRYRDGDLALAVAQTDAKGDRSKRPSEQLDPDLNVRVLEKRSDGIIVRGAKVHTSCSPYVDEIIVLPSRSMGAGDERLEAYCQIYLKRNGLVPVPEPIGEITRERKVLLTTGAGKPVPLRSSGWDPFREAPKGSKAV